MLNSEVLLSDGKPSVGVSVDADAIDDFPMWKKEPVVLEKEAQIGVGFANASSVSRL